jgi:hypothetical protein
LSSGLRIATPEDLFILKLIADRNKDFKELLDLGALPDLDWGYIEHWTTIWGVHDRIERYRSRQT